jgi:DSBA-like thioredoxin domain
MVVRVDLFADPACTWSWLTSRWLVEVAPKRGLQVRWRSYSLLLRDGREGLEDWKAALWGASHRAVRVMQALHADDPDRVRGFYEALVTQSLAASNAGGPPFQDLQGALAAAGLAPTYAAAADDAALDEPIRRSMAEAFAAVGQGVGTPVLVVHLDPPVGLHGPLVSPPPTGTDAVRLWDAAVAFATMPGVLELSRPRPRRPTVPGLRS